MSPRIAILEGVRTPFAKSGGSFKNVAADDLGAIVVREVLAKTGIDPGAFDEVVIGNVAQPIHAANVSRVIALKAGLPNQVVAHTVHRNCASGMQALSTGALQIISGQSDLVIAGGTECMSQIPLLFGAKMTELFVRLMRARTVGQRVKVLSSFRPSYLKPIIAIQLGLTDPICGLNMGETAEVLAREFGIDRAEQDRYALQSHQRAVEAMKEGRFGEEIVPVPVMPAYERLQMHDDGPRPEQSIEALKKLRPFFDRHAGTVTAGNACPLTDGAVALVLASERKVKELGIEPLGWITGSACAGLDGRRMGLGPAFATSKLLDDMNMEMSDFDLFELNEAFAAQVLANQVAFASDAFAQEELGRKKALGELPDEKLNVNGGAIALGHPVGATGARMALTLLKEMKRRGLQRGIASLCISGGLGAAIALEAA
ncbi:MAG: thiolase family protein [Planctomycetota bacterium]|nr:thiolase family protein [Planctomycetota bacterium]